MSEFILPAGMADCLIDVFFRDEQSVRDMFRMADEENIAFLCEEAKKRGYDVGKLLAEETFRNPFV